MPLPLIRSLWGWPPLCTRSNPAEFRWICHRHPHTPKVVFHPVSYTREFCCDSRGQGRRAGRKTGKEKICPKSRGEIQKGTRVSFFISASVITNTWSQEQISTKAETKPTGIRTKTKPTGIRTKTNDTVGMFCYCNVYANVCHCRRSMIAEAALTGVKMQSVGKKLPPQPDTPRILSLKLANNTSTDGGKKG